MRQCFTVFRDAVKFKPEPSSLKRNPISEDITRLNAGEQFFAYRPRRGAPRVQPLGDKTISLYRTFIQIQIHDH